LREPWSECRLAQPGCRAVAACQASMNASAVRPTSLAAMPGV